MRRCTYCQDCMDIKWAATSFSKRYMPTTHLGGVAYCQLRNQIVHSRHANCSRRWIINFLTVISIRKKHISSKTTRYCYASSVKKCVVVDLELSFYFHPWKSSVRDIRFIIDLEWYGRVLSREALLLLFSESTGSAYDFLRN